MNTLMILLTGLTLLLAVTYGISLAINRQASKAHWILLLGISSVVALPVLSIVAQSFGWGLLTPNEPIVNSNEHILNAEVSTTEHLDRSTDFPQGNAIDPSNQHASGQSDSEGDVLAAFDRPTVDDAESKQNSDPLDERSIDGDIVVAQPALLQDHSSKNGFDWSVLLPVAMVTWISLSTLFVIRIITSTVLAFRILHTSKPLNNPKLDEALEFAKNDIEFDRAIQIRTSSLVPCPVVWGWFRPIVLVPENGLEKTVDWRGIFTHELAHVKRRDHLCAALAEAAKCLLPWHPLVLLGCRRLHRLSELACDAWALSFTNDAERYVESLVAFVPNARQPLFSSMATKRSNIRQRAEVALADSKPSPRAGFTFSVLILAITATCVTALALIREHASGVITQPEIITPNNQDDDEFQTWTDDEWTQRLVNVPESARWHVGRNLGDALSQLPDGRGYKILSICWNDIAVSVRKQILKGYTPDTEINSHFFQVMNLGMQSADAGIRHFAVSYLDGVIHRNFESDQAAYETWYQTTDGMDADEIVAREIKEHIAIARDPSKRNVHEFVGLLVNNQRQFERLSVARETLFSEDVEELLVEWKNEGVLSPMHAAFKVVERAKSFEQHQGIVQVTDALSSNATDEQWIEHLTSLPNSMTPHMVRQLVGVQLAEMPGDRAFNILSQCWNDIDNSVRKQILVGITPTRHSQNYNPRYIDIIGLAIQSREHDVRSQAFSLLNRITLARLVSQEEFEAWQEENLGKSCDEITREACEQFVSSLEGSSEIALAMKLDTVRRNSALNPLLKENMEKAGLGPKLDMLLRTGKISLRDRHFVSIISEYSITPSSMRIAIDRELKRMVEIWEIAADASHSAGRLNSREIWDIAGNLGMVNYPYVIPTMIGIIEADNSYDTIYGVGYFGLAQVTGVKYRAYHDGAWWRRWWEANKETLPEEVQKLEIPTLTKSAHGEKHVPFPEHMERLDVKLDWILKRHAAGLDYDVALDELEEENVEPVAIPVLIGVLDSDNSSRMITDIGRCLREITGVNYSRLTDGAFWRRWWEENKHKYPENVQSIPIPDLPKTAFGETYEPVPAQLDTLDGKIEYLRDNDVDEQLFERIVSDIERRQADTLIATDIPKLIGILEADNSERTLYSLGSDCLKPLTGVEFSPLHDGAWWRRWWEANKAGFPEKVRNIPIPDLRKTRHGESYVSFPAALESIDEKIAFLNTLRPTDTNAWESVLLSLEFWRWPDKTRPETDIPKLIGVIEADNSYRSVFSIGEHVLGDITGVDYNPWHDGAWWRRWWERNKTRFSKEAQAIEIPRVKKSAYGEQYQPFPAEMDTLEGKIKWVQDGCPAFGLYPIHYLGNALCEHRDERAIPVLIGWMLADKSIRALDTRIEVFEELTGVSVSNEQTAEWWKNWWEKNKSRFSAEAQATPIPDLTDAVAKYHAAEKAHEFRQQDEEFAGIPSTERKIDSDERKTYFQIGPRDGLEAPENGWKIMFILPGGDGSADFHPFCRRIHKHALPDDFVAIQLVAPVWSDDDNRVVWPTEKLNSQKAKFTTETFFTEALKDIKEHIPVDEEFVFALGWSSGGPPIYVTSVMEDSPLTGSFVAMSVFHPKQMSDVSRAKDHPYFILHSPGDFINIDQHARKAIKDLDEVGAKTRLQLYSGGHGWVDDPFGNIRRGVQWLEEQVDE